MNGPEALVRLREILSENQWTIDRESVPYPSMTHPLADDLLMDLIREHVPESEEFLQVYDDMVKWYE